MYKSYKFRLYPYKKELELINKTFGSSRFIYNHYLSNIKENGYKNAYTNIKDYVNNLKYEYPFLEEIDSIINSIIIRSTLFHLDENIKRYYNNGFKYPKYKSRYDKNSYTTNCLYALFTSNSFEESLLKVISYGGNTYTNACIVGSMAEALYGIDESLIKECDKKIPNEFVKIIKLGYSKIK